MFLLYRILTLQLLTVETDHTQLVLFDFVVLLSWEHKDQIEFFALSL